jgi:sugar phosphate isomerase/epimerase
LLSLAAGTLTGCSAVDAIRVAARAGFDLVGLRPDLSRLLDADIAGARRAAEESGVGIFDIEVVRIGTMPAYLLQRLIDFACGVGAAHLLVVSEDEDRNRAIEAFRDICIRAAGGGVRPVLEFMAFTAVQDLDAAMAMVAAVDHPAAAILVDSLHLARSGGTAAQVAGVDRSLIPYVQLCDGPALGPSGVAALADEARHRRLPPGLGQLPLAAFLEATPRVTLSIEVQSDVGWATRTPQQWAGDVLLATDNLLAGAGLASS